LVKTDPTRRYGRLGDFDHYLFTEVETVTVNPGQNCWFSQLNLTAGPALV
jgi:hypothetical protein